MLHQVHVALIRMVRSGPEVASWDIVVDSCSVRAKRDGELTGPYAERTWTVEPHAWRLSMPEVASQAT